MGQAHSEVQIDNEHFRATKWIIDPGAEIPMHDHPYEYVVVPLTDSTMHVTNADGSEIVAELRIGESYTRSAGARHQVENRVSTDPIVFVEIEKL